MCSRFFGHVLFLLDLSPLRAVRHSDISKRSVEIPVGICFAGLARINRFDGVRHRKRSGTSTSILIVYVCSSSMFVIYDGLDTFLSSHFSFGLAFPFYFNPNFPGFMFGSARVSSALEFAQSRRPSSRLFDRTLRSPITILLRLKSGKYLQSASKTSLSSNRR
ncbi:hypothetical protein LEP1GSC168_0819 [Leptospira santarosai str. HAI134]|nr:hypothetical protein LEP1GSC168_0819 [Leptospira santarosai str. HAI134]